MTLTSIFPDAESLRRALARLDAAGLRGSDAYSPVGLPELEQHFPRRGSPLRFFMLAAAIVGGALGLTMCIGSAEVYGLILGGKHPATLLPYCVLWFELTVLFGGITGFTAIVSLANLRPDSSLPGYDPRFNEDRFGLHVECATDRAEEVTRLLRESGAEEVHEHVAA
jgi:hypothetical protein